jgi:hypothetical protein
MTHCGRSLKSIGHHNIRAGNHGYVTDKNATRGKSALFGTFRPQAVIACGTDIAAIHYRPDAEPNRTASIQFI